MEDTVLYNVYAWRQGKPAVIVAECVPLAEAWDVCSIYQAKGHEWDAYIVRVDDDPGYRQ